jgi:hypothetical protein
MTYPNRLWCSLILFLVSFLADVSLAASSQKYGDDGGTSVGGGGDPVYFFLEVTRRKLLDVISRLQLEPAGIKELCDAEVIRASGRDDCQRFLAATVVQLRTLNQGDHKTKFEVTSESLTVEGPDGRPIEVVARTSYGPAGVIQFNRMLLSRLGPQQVLLLLTHEFGHKVNFDSEVVRDNVPFGSYPTGREFLDDLGAGFVHVAIKYGMIGRQFGLSDTFICQIRGNGQFPSQHAFSERRVFYGESLKNYDAGFGREGERMSPVLLTPEGDISLKLITHDDDSCVDSPEANQARRTIYSVIRTKVVNGQPNEEVLASREFEGLNPLCQLTQEPLLLAWDRYQFQCSYVETNGTTREPMTKK